MNGNMTHEDLQKRNIRTFELRGKTTESDSKIVNQEKGTQKRRKLQKDELKFWKHCVMKLKLCRKFFQNNRKNFKGSLLVLVKKIGECINIHTKRSGQLQNLPQPTSPAEEWAGEDFAAVHEFL